MAVTRLSLYNNALYILGERRLVTEFEDREPRRVLDEIANLNAYEVVLELVKPRFAVTSAKLSNPSASSVHGVDKVYAFAWDYISTLGEAGLHGANASFFSDENFQNPINRYIIEGRTVACDVETNIWMRYISKTPDLDVWTPMFGKLVATYLAKEAASRINPNRIEYAEQQFAQALAISIQYESVKENPIIPQKAAADLTADQLVIYNQVAHALGKNEFRHVADGSSLRLAIDAQYDLARDFLLETVKPRFATTSVTLTDAGDSTSHTFDNVFTLPSDFLTLVSIHSDENLDFPVERYLHEDDEIFVDASTPIYLRYIQNDVTEPTWTATFKRALSAHIATNLCPLFANEREQSAFDLFDKALTATMEADASREVPYRAQQAAGVLSTAKLTVYNQIAQMLGQRELRHVNDESELRVAIDAEYTLARNFVLEAVKPRFATITAALADADNSAVHGFDNVFTIPTDLLLLCGIWSDENLDFPVLRYLHEDTEIFVDAFDPIYIRYVQSAVGEAEWTATFTKAVAAHIAHNLSSRFSPEREQNALAVLTSALAIAVEVDSTREAPDRPQKAAAPLTASQLVIYNQIAHHLGQPELRHVNNESALRLAIDAQYELATDHLLEKISPKFATETATLADADDSAVHGFDNVFTIPTNMVTLSGVWSDENLDFPVLRYLHEDTQIFVDAFDPIYIRYVKKEVAETSWTPTFKQALAAHIATRLSGAFAAERLEYLSGMMQETLSSAITADSTREAPDRPQKAAAPLTASQLAIYNQIAHHLGQPELRHVNNESALRLAIDAQYELATDHLLEKISPKFATETATLADADDSAVHGFDNVFTIPTNMVTLSGVWSDENLDFPVLRYLHEDTQIFVDAFDPIYIRYVKKEVAETSWTPTFKQALAAHIATRLSGAFAAERLEYLSGMMQETLSSAITADSTREAPDRPQKAAAPLTASQLAIYNQIAHHLGQPELRHVNNESALRLAIDAQYGLATDHLLEKISPKFATETATLADAADSTVHGFDNVFTIPTNMVTLLGVWSDENLDFPVLRYLHEDTQIFVDAFDPIYIRYVKKEVAETAWTPTFKQALAAHIATRLSGAFAAERLEYLSGMMQETLSSAITADSTREAPDRPQKAAAPLTASQLAIYNQIAHHLGQPELRHVNNESALRLAIDAQYELATDHLLEKISPKFATETATLADAADSAVHGFDNVFTIPTNMVTLLGVWSDENLDFPVLRYLHEDTEIFVDAFDPIYIRYVKKEVAETAWTPTFKQALAAHIATRLSGAFAAERLEYLSGMMQETLSSAITADSTREAPDRPQKAAAPLTASQLVIYNQIAHHLGQPELRHVNNESALRLAIDAQYDLATDYLLEKISPRFATETTTLADAGDSAVHAFDNVFTTPANMVTLLGVWSDENLDFPVLRYLHEDTEIFVDAFDPIYIRYIKNEVVETAWTPTFKQALAAYIATRLSGAFAAERLEYLSGMMQETLSSAITADSTREAPVRPQKAAAPLSAEKLAIYNQIAQSLGQKELRHVNDESELRLAIDSHYAIIRDQLLETIKPRFATTFAVLTDSADSSVHAFDNVFTLPTGLVTLVGVFSDIELDQPVTRYLHEDTELYVANYPTVYLRYIQNEIAESAWTATYKLALSAKIAARLAPRFALKNEDPSSPSYASAVKYLMASFENEVVRAMQDAMVADSMIEPQTRPIKATRVLDDEYRALYNKALQILGLPQLTSNTDESARKVALDYAIDNKAVETVFELISWGFLYKRLKLSASVSEIPSFGFQYAFDVPADFIRIDSVSADEYFRHPQDYTREGDFFYADVKDLYIRYLSNAQVTTPAVWPVYIHNLVAAELARNCSGVLDADRDNARIMYQEYKDEAYNTDAQRNPPQVITTGSWVGSRASGTTRRNGRP